MSRADKANDITRTQTDTQQKKRCVDSRFCATMQLVKDATCQSFSVGGKKKNNKNFSKDTKALCYTAICVVHRKPSNQGTELETVHFNAAPPPLMLMSSSLPLLIHCPFSTCCQKKNHSKIPVHEKRGKKKPNSHFANAHPQPEAESK